MVREVARSPHLADAGRRRPRGDSPSIQRVIEQGQADGVFRAELDPRLASWVVYGGLEEILTGWVLGPAPRRRRGGRACRADRSSTSSAAGWRRRAVRGLTTGSRRRTVVALGVGAFGLAWSLTTTAAYLPPLLERVHRLDDARRARARRRGRVRAHAPARDRAVERHVPHAARPAAAVHARRARADGVLPRADRVHAEPLDDGAARSSRFFFAYYVYEPPYRGLYPDVLPDKVFGRAQGVQHVFRGIALGGALIGGGFLFHLWQPAPFLVAAFVVTAACAGADRVRARGRRPRARVRGRARPTCATRGACSAANPDVAPFLVANTAWEGTFAGARTFVVLYITVGLDEPLVDLDAVLAAVAGRLHRRRARRRARSATGSGSRA